MQACSISNPHPDRIITMTNSNLPLVPLLRPCVLPLRRFAVEVCQ